MTLEDTLWDLLDKLHLGEFFDEHNIPPIVFPIAVVAVVALIFLLLSGGGPADPCNYDGECNVGENATNCPSDCQPPPPPPPEGKDVKAHISGGTTCGMLRVTLRDSAGGVVEGPKNTANRVLTFRDVVEERVYLEVSAAQSDMDPIESGVIDTDSEDTIRLTLPDDYCEAEVEYGDITVTLLDNKTGSTMGADVSLFDSGGTLKDSRYISGSGTFGQLEPDQYYYFTATATGYDDYFGGSERIFVGKNQEKSKTLRMDPEVTVEATGELEVCVSGEDEACPPEGEISIYDLEDNLVKVGSLSGCPLTHGGSVSARCFTFDLPAGKQFYAAVTKAPGGCSVSSKEGPFLISETSKETVTIRLDCNLIGYVRAIVYANDTVATSNCTVELRYDDENDTLIKVMNMSPDGNYTETVPVPAPSEVRVYAKNVPEGYLPSSEDADIEQNVTATVEIDLRTPLPPMPNLTIVGAQVSKVILNKNQTFRMSAGSVRMEGRALTPGDGVEVVCQNSWSSSRVYANYTGGSWACEMVSPFSLGQKTVSMKATKDGANDDAKAFTLYVVNDSVRTDLLVESDRQAFQTMNSPVELYFIVNRTDAGGTPVAPLEEVLESILEVEYDGRLVVNTSVYRVRDGYFGTEFDVPYAGDYTFTLTVKAVINETLHMGGHSFGFTVLVPAEGAMRSCAVAPELASPSEFVKVMAELELGGEPLPHQRLMVTIQGGAGEFVQGEMYWNSTSERYEYRALPHDSECVQTVNCSVVNSPGVSASTILYVADPDAAGVDGTQCPTNAFYCDSLEDVRDCYSLYSSTGQAEYYNHALDCAMEGLEECGAPSEVSKCYQAVVFNVWNGTGHEWRTYQVEGPTGGKRVLEPALADEGDYSMRGVFMSGGSIYGPASKDPDCPGPVTECESEVMALEMNSSTGEVTVEAYCPVSCGGRGDLNDDGSVDDLDRALLGPVMDTVALLGAPAYDPWPLTCVDANGDLTVTWDDYVCLDSLLNPDDCLSCWENLPEGVDSTLEVCNDGYDNDCDGQIDRETYDNLAGEFYRDSEGRIVNACACNEATPCEMVWDIQSPAGYSKETDIKRCSDIGGEGYEWRADGDWQCNEARKGQTLACGGKEYYCAKSGDLYLWYNKADASDTYPPSPLPGGSGSQTHYVCNTAENKCELVGGGGEHECAPGGYWGVCEHRTCEPSGEGGICLENAGPGTDECAADGQCLQPLYVLEKALTTDPDLPRRDRIYRLTAYPATRDELINDYAYALLGTTGYVYTAKKEGAIPVYQIRSQAHTSMYYAPESGVDSVLANPSYQYESSSKAGPMFYVMPVGTPGTTPLLPFWSNFHTANYYTTGTWPDLTPPLPGNAGSFTYAGGGEGENLFGSVYPP